MIILQKQSKLKLQAHKIFYKTNDKTRDISFKQTPLDPIIYFSFKNHMTDILLWETNSNYET